MRNLAISEVKQNFLNLDSGDKICVVCMGHSEGQASTKMYVCTHNLNVVHFDDFNSEIWRKSLADQLEPGNLPVDITYLTLSDSLCLALSHGDIVNISGDGCLLERVGVCSDGILVAEWSPDQEFLVLVTKALKTLLMPYTFDPPAHEVNLLSEEFGEKQFVTVGWGKKETQFHGSEGKQARTKNEVLPEAIDVTDETVKVTWRGDGQLYAIGFTYEGLRRFKIFDRDGQLQYTSEKQPGLQANMSWRPSGNVIATTQKLQDKYLVAFFEKNGLKHGDFTIPVNFSTTVEDISWSYNSEILGLQCLDTSDNTQKVLIFTTSNYHWYLKQTLRFETRITKMVWDNDFDVASHKKLHIILHNGEHYIYNWIWNVDHSYGQTDNDDGTVAVIDGKQILLTGFRQTIIPPPMAALSLNLDCQVNSIHFSSNQDESNNFFVCTAEEKLIFYNKTNKHPLSYEVINEITLDKYKIPFRYFNWHWVNKNIIVCTKTEDGEYSVVEFEINGKKLNTKNTTLLASCVMKVHPHPRDSSKIFLQLNNGEIMQYTIGGEISPLEVSFPVACPFFSVIEVENRLHFLGLSHKNNFYIDDSLILNNVNSFYVHTHFLLLTTLSHVILTIELTHTGLNAIKDYKKIESPHVYKRKVERGSRLVIAVPNDTRTILQMPRGNLEAIQPRPLSLIIIGKYLENLKYYEAFDLMRKQRINLNLIYDHDPERFLLNVDAFLESIKNNSWLSLFLSDLENTDTTTTMYASSYAARECKSNNNIDKVVKVCDVIRDRLKNRSDCDTKVLPLITTYVKKNTVEDLEMALFLIMKMKEQEGTGAKLPVGSDEALKYLLYMVDVNKLFDIALGMYEFDLVVLVANKSQKDPKEYVSMLNEFNEMEDNYKRFSVNKHLKRFDRAVECLAKCGASKHEELRNFVKYHSLYRKALDLFNPEDAIFKDISEDFGSYLRLQKQNIEAGLIYRRAKNYSKAIECFKDALEWELAIEIAYNHLDNTVFLELCWDLINALKQERRHQEAITILDSYYGNPNETILYCIEAGFYRTALRLCSQHGKTDLKEEKLKPRLLEEYESLNTLIQNNWCTFIRYKDRLGSVRLIKRTTPFEQYDHNQGNRDCDLYSDAGSTIASSTSRSSSRTYRSSKNRRKHERKVASLKEGSQYEDVALVMALHTLVTSSFELRPLAREFIVTLTCFEEDHKATTLQQSLDKLLKDMRDSFRDIWTNELALEATNAAVAALDVPEGCSVVVQGIATLEPHLRIAPVIQEVTWKLEGLD